MRRRYALGLMVVLAACSSHAADIAVPNPSSTTLPSTAGRPTADPTEVVAITPTTPAATSATGVAGATPSGGAPPTADAPPDAPATTAPVTTAPPDPVDQALASDTVLRAGDLPGWAVDSRGRLADDTIPGGCRHLRAGAWPRRAHAAATFVAPDGSREISNEVSVFDSPERAAATLAAVDAKATPTCFETVLRGGADGFRVSDASVRRFPVRDGDGGVGYDATLRVDVAGASYTFVVRIEYVRVGRALSFGLAFAPDQPADEAATAFDAVADRLAAEG